MGEHAREEKGGVKVVDRRRFDMDGNLRDEAAGGDGSARAAAEERAAEKREEQPAGEREEQPPSNEGASAEAIHAEHAAHIERLEAELAAARKRIDDLARAYQALEKDREEFKQRLRREREQMLDVERGNVAMTLLEAVDELDLCLAVSREESPLAQGVRMIRDNVLRKVELAGLERLNLVGTTFDPALAEAVDVEVTPNADDDQKVLAEVRAGYKLKDRIIRPARVKVAKYVKPADA